MHLTVGELVEVIVPRADRDQVGGGDDGDKFVHVWPQFGGHGLLHDRHGQDERGRLLRAHHRDRGAYGGAGGDAVVHQNDGAVADGGCGASVAVYAFAAIEFGLLHCGRFVDHGLRDPQAHHDIVVEHAHAAGTDGAHGELFVPGHAQFARVEQIERRVERTRHFVRHGKATARQPQHEEFTATHVLEFFCQRLAGTRAVGELSGHAIAPRVTGRD